MKILIPCKTKEELDIYSNLFKWDRKSSRHDRVWICKDNIEIEIFIFNEYALCGLRGNSVLINHSFSVEEWQNCLLPLVVVPMDLKERMEKQNMEEVKKSILGIDKQ